MTSVQVHHGDSRAVLKGLADASIDSVVTDPPYALVSIGKRFGADDAAPAKVGKSGAYARASKGFMGQRWDTGETAFSIEFWAEVMRVLKPGGHVVAASGTRTYHRLACAIEDAGFEVRDMVSWLYGSGFPKSHDVSKGIDRRRDDRADIVAVALWLRPYVERVGFAEVTAHFGFKDETMARARWTSASQPSVPRWEQWVELKALCGFGDEMDAEVWRLNGRTGTPGEAWDSREVVGQGYRVRRESTVQVAGNSDGALDLTAAATDDSRRWEGWGTALKPACEPWVLARKPLVGTVAGNVLAHGTGALNIDSCRIHGDDAQGGEYTVKRLKPGATLDKTGGNWRPDDGVEFVGNMKPGRWPANVIHDGSDEVIAAFPAELKSGTGAVKRSSAAEHSGNSGSALGKESRPAGTPMISHGDSGSAARFFYSAKADAEDRLGSKHPTVKPVDLMQWLCRLVTPPGGLILDPFAGSGSTGLAAMNEGFDCILIEREEKFVADINRRLAWARGEGRLTVQEMARDIEPANAGGLDMPLFAGNAQPASASQPAGASSTGNSPATSHRADGDDEVVAA